jgi:hypothetical protein
MPEQVYDAIAGNLAHLPDEASVLAYSDGAFAANAEQVARFHRVRWITVTGDYTRAGAADWLPDNRFDLARYVAGRLNMGVRARVYVARAFARIAMNALGYPHAGQPWADPRVLWWIPTLDGKEWTPDALAASCAAFDAPISAGKLWANQWTQLPSLGNPSAYADQSSLFLPW